MSYLENEFNKRFNNQELSGDDFDSDGLWDDISEELDIAPASGTNGSAFGGKWIYFLSALLVVGGVIGFAIWQMSDSNSAIEKAEVAKVESIEDDQLSISPTIDKEETEASNQNLEQEKIAIQSIENSQASIQESKTISKTEIKNRSFKNKKNYNSTQFIVSENIENESSFSQKDNRAQRSDETILSTKIDNQTIHAPIASTTDFNPKNESSNSNLSEKTAIDELPLLPFVFTSLQSNNLLLPEYNSLSVEKKKTKAGSGLTFQLELIGGINAIDFKHNSTVSSRLAERRSFEEKIFPGGSIGLLAGVKLKNNLLINSGIEYHQLWSKFDHYEERLIDSLLENQLLKVWISRSTGDTLREERGSVREELLETRNVVHFNQLHRLSIPLEIGMRKNSGRFLYGISIGGVFNYTYSQSGRMLNDNFEVVDFETDNPKFKKIDFGFRVRPVVGYQSEKNWLVTLQPQWMWSQNAIQDASETKVDFHQFNLNLGIGYGF